MLNIIIDKCALLFLCTVLLVTDSSFILPVIVFTSSLTISAISQSFIKTRISLAAEIIFLVLCLKNPIFCCMIPLITYDVLCEKRYISAMAYTASFIFRFGYFEISHFFIIAASIVISVILQHRNNNFQNLHTQFMEIRDSSAETKMLLEEKNKTLREKQDSEIYLATLKERNRIAREIHDNVGHMLTRAILQLGAMRVINKDENQREGLESLNETINSAMTSIRNSVHNLHDDSIDLRYAVEDMANPLRENYTVECSYDFSCNTPKKIKLCFIGIIKECFSNTVKHSRADKISVVIREHPAFYQLIVKDNGKCDEIKSSGIGLSNMKERVEDLNGIISFTPSQNGFRVFVSVPKKFSEDN